MKFLNFIFLSSLLFFTACVSNPYFVLKNHHFDTPEARGTKFKLSASVAPYQDVTTVVSAIDYSAAQPEQSGAIITKNDRDASDTVEFFDHSSVLFDLSITERVDIGIDFAVGNQPTFFKAKYQFVGDPRANATEGNFSLAGVLGLGIIAVSEDDTIEFNGTTRIGSFNVDGQVIRAGLIAGARTNSELLVYWSNSFSQYFTKTKYERTITSISSSGDFRTDGIQILSMLGLEYVLNNSISLNLEYGLAHATADEAESETFSSFGAKVGFLFN